MSLQIHGGRDKGMIYGILSTAFTFILLILSTISYYLYHKNEKTYILKIARSSFYTASGLILLQAIILMWGIHTHQFHWQYVFSYSSTDLSTYYLTSTFWAGQEGTFLLWLLFGSIYGLILIRTRVKNESIIMVFMLLVQAFITMILIKKNPFTYIWDLNPLGFQEGMIPVNGNGLNPLLQDPWMVIHPPVLFIGYSSAMILFAFAMAALITKKYDEWIKDVFPYSLFVSLSLGTGIIMGGYWAYTTLGWGGYWAWDPVENSSLIPWLTSLVLLHGLIIQKKQGGLKKTNIFMAWLTFILVLYGSFLTRSGILSDFSVHSFSQTVINNYLVAFLIFFLAIALIMFLFKNPKTTSNEFSSILVTRENFMFFGILTILISSIFTFLGTSAPLITGIFAGKASNVSLEYYNLLNIPVVILAGLFIAISPILSWKRKSNEKIKGIIYHVIGSIIVAIFSFIVGLRQAIPLTIFTVFVLVVFINGEIVIRLFKKNKWEIGGYLAHVGIGVMLIGIIISSIYDTTTKAVLPLEDDTNILGYNMKYLGFQKGNNGKDQALISITNNTHSFQAAPKFYWSDYSQSYMRNPSVHNLWLKDLYISPIQIIRHDQNELGKELTLIKDEVEYFEDFTIMFSGYDIDSHEMSNEQLIVPTILNFSNSNGQFVVKPAIKIINNIKTDIPAKIPNTEKNVYIKEINVNDNSLKIMIKNEKSVQKEMLAVEVTEKPLINLLWLGTFLMVGGMLIAIINRVKFNKL
jgi:cytochrome c-type biogenesis protein CcmF